MFFTPSCSGLQYTGICSALAMSPCYLYFFFSRQTADASEPAQSSRKISVPIVYYSLLLGFLASPEVDT